MLLPLVSDRVHPPLAVEFARLVAAANLVYFAPFTVPIRCVADHVVERGMAGFFWYDRRSCELRVACPYKRATKGNVKRLGKLIAHELLHFDEWLKLSPEQRERVELDEPDDEREAEMLTKLLEAYQCSTPKAGTATTKKNRT